MASVAQKLADLAQIEVRAKLFKNGGVATNDYTWGTARHVFWAFLSLQKIKSMRFEHFKFAKN